MKRLMLLYVGLLILRTSQVYTSPVEDVEGVQETPEKSEDNGEEAAKGIGNWFSSAAEEISEDAKEKSDSGLGLLKGFAGGLGDRFGKAKEKISEAGDKMKETVGDAALNVQEEFGNAASKISKHAKDATDTMMGMFG